jgi:hypothetical protein
MDQCAKILGFLKGKISKNNVGVMEITRTYVSGTRYTDELNHGAIYCYALQLDAKEKAKVFESMKDVDGQNKKLISVEQWRPIVVDELDNNLYPLYIGESAGLGSRMIEHLSNYKSNRSIHLNKLNLTIKSHDIYFATVSSSQTEQERLKTESSITKDFPSLLQTYEVS